jgi:hypothetical protein
VKQPALESDPLAISVPAALLSLATAIAALVALAGLHFLSPEFEPSSRVVSEYALGRHAWALSLMFLVWGASSWTLAFAIRSQIKTPAAKVGLAFLVAAGLGEGMASVFDIGWPAMHGLSGALGILSLPIAATLISASLARTQQWSRVRGLLLSTAGLTWLSLALIAVAMSTLRSKVLSLPIGWPNRFLIVAYSAWVIVVAWQAIRLRRSSQPS